MPASAVRCLLAASLLVQIAMGASQHEDHAGRSNMTVCLQPKVEGPCRGQLPHYYYDRYTQTCLEFLYGGCGGNGNNFESLEDCEKTCWKIKKVPKVCRMEEETGPCRSYLKRYAYNLASMKCEQFIYGGCYGNDNNFRDEASCLEKCAPKRNAPSFCYSPMDGGSCSASVTRYYFNVESKACEEFTYTGCGGNSNNFVRREDCISTCKKGNKKPRIRNRIRKLKTQS
ncbi:tissue factor pathway inhibitor 2 [Pseudophryne corroboree]|uniref:tissue factor pathway inhibitor 2 n=1 Tax=Pseudophryne corroboree TaxID=495146 RepID=UPI00308200D3